MKRSRKNLGGTLLLCLSLLCVSGCGITDTNENLSSLESGISVGVYGPFISGESSHYTLEMTTNQIFSYYNRQIANHVSIRNGIISVTITGLTNPMAHAEAFGPAKAYEDIWLTEGEYLLEIKDGSQVDVYTISIQDTNIIHQAVSTSYSRIAENVVLHSMPNTFISYCSTPDGSEWVYSAWYDSLRANPLLNEITDFPDIGQYKGVYEIQHPHHIFQYEEEMGFWGLQDDFAQFNDYLNQNGVSAELQLINWQGGKIHQF